MIHHVNNKFKTPCPSKRKALFRFTDLLPVCFVYTLLRSCFSSPTAFSSSWIGLNVECLLHSVERWLLPANSSNSCGGVGISPSSVRQLDRFHAHIPLEIVVQQRPVLKGSLLRSRYILTIGLFPSRKKSIIDERRCHTHDLWLFCCLQLFLIMVNPVPSRPSPSAVHF